VPPDGVAVLALARLVEQKRLERFVDVLAELPPGVVGLIAGEGPLRPELEARARVRDAPVRFLGHVDEVGNLLAAADVLLLTSDREGMANAMLEAMAAGLLVISTPVAGAREALEGTEDGVPPGRVTTGFEAEQLRRALEPLVADRVRREAMGRAAAVRAARRYGPAAMLDRWEALLRDLRPRPPSA
jgi:glycosyltransferase involved in cell wall biosynthesis